MISQRYLANFIFSILTVVVTLPANTDFQYKYIRIFNGVVTWESDPNNSQTTASSWVICDQ